MMDLKVVIRKASKFGFEENMTIDSDELHDTLMKLKDRHDCGSFVVHYDYMYEDKLDEVSITIYDSYIE